MLLFLLLGFRSLSTYLSYDESKTIKANIFYSLMFARVNSKAPYTSILQMMKLTLQEIEVFVQDVQQESVKPGYVQ